MENRFQKHFRELIESTKQAVELHINEHKNSNETIEEYLLGEDIEFEELSMLKQQRTKELDSVIVVIVNTKEYPSTENITVVHYDIVLAIDEALTLFRLAQ